MVFHRLSHPPTFIIMTCSLDPYVFYYGLTTPAQCQAIVPPSASCLCVLIYPPLHRSTWQPCSFSGPILVSWIVGKQ